MTRKGREKEKEGRDDKMVSYHEDKVLILLRKVSLLKIKKKMVSHNILELLKKLKALKVKVMIVCLDGNLPEFHLVFVGGRKRCGQNCHQ